MLVYLQGILRERRGGLLKLYSWNVRILIIVTRYTDIVATKNAAVSGSKTHRVGSYSDITRRFEPEGRQTYTA